MIRLTAHYPRLRPHCPASLPPLPSFPTIDALSQPISPHCQTTDPLSQPTHPNRQATPLSCPLTLWHSQPADTAGQPDDPVWRPNHALRQADFSFQPTDETACPDELTKCSATFPVTRAEEAVASQTVPDWEPRPTHLEMRPTHQEDNHSRSGRITPANRHCPPGL